MQSHLVLNAAQHLAFADPQDAWVAFQASLRPAHHAAVVVDVRAGHDGAKAWVTTVDRDPHNLLLLAQARHTLMLDVDEVQLRALHVMEAEDLPSPGCIDGMSVDVRLRGVDVQTWHRERNATGMLRASRLVSGVCWAIDIIESVEPAMAEVLRSYLRHK